MDGDVHQGIVADWNVPPGNTVDEKNNLGQQTVNPTNGQMRRNHADRACPHINPNVGGVRNGEFGLFGNRFGFLRNF